nr:ABC transporter ATP-binding protein [uncultured Shimia sp.]
MSIAHLLKDFAIVTNASASGFSTQNSENDLLDSYEQGYKAGWDDGVLAKSQEQAHISTSLAQNLQDLSFTYQEAKSATLAELAPVVEQIIMTFVPEVARQALGLRIVEQINELSSEIGNTGIEILVSAENYDCVAPLIPTDLPFPVALLRGEHLQDGQADLRFGSRERQIDLNEVRNGLTDAFGGFVHELKKEVAHG